MIRVTQAQTARFILQKNSLITGMSDLTQMVRSIGGLPDDHALTAYLAAYARLTTFKPADLLNTLYQSGRLATGIFMRSQPYVVSETDFVTFYAATARQRRQNLNAEFRLWGVENRDIEQIGEAIIAAVGMQPATDKAIIEQLPAEMVREVSQTSRGGRVSTTTTAALALRWLVVEGRLALGRERGKLHDWRNTEFVYAPLTYWHPGIDLGEAQDEASAQAEVVRTYLAAFGPATEADISFWTGFGKSETARAVSTLSSETVMTLIEGLPGMTLLLKAQAEVLSATEIDAAVVNVLPADDPFITAHRASRQRYFDDPSLQRQVFDNQGGAKPTIIVNGRIVGTWDEPTEESFGMLDWRLLTRVDATVEPLIEAEIERVEKFFAASS